MMLLTNAFSLDKGADGTTVPKPRPRSAKGSDHTQGTIGAIIAA
jgi:hypothetical protein